MSFDFAAPIPEWPELSPDLESLLLNIEAEQETGPRHPRPWDLAALPESLREPTWTWLEAAVRWINLCGGWQPTTVVPPCWARHPHLALELAVLAFGREIAARTTLPDHLRDWHVDLQAFQVRMADALGETALKDCQRGKHGDRPSAYELESYEQAATNPQTGRAEVVHRSRWNSGRDAQTA
ncbi:MAG: hypothetical protein ACT4QF_05090 [Sporichthyaceae bacterium]